MYAQSAKKHLFMGSEIGQWGEWNHEGSLEWHLLQYDLHAGLHRWVKDLNRFYRAEPALYELDFDPAGFEWIDCDDSEGSTLSLLRKGKSPDDVLLVVLNFTPVLRQNYRVGAPRGGFWREALNSDAWIYGGSGQGNLGGVEAAPVSFHGRPHMLTMTLPPVAAVFLKPAGETP
jgi:1,4-alpha-glucan branching enzyme